MLNTYIGVVRVNLGVAGVVQLFFDQPAIRTVVRRRRSRSLVAKLDDARPVEGNCSSAAYVCRGDIAGNCNRSPGIEVPAEMVKLPATAMVPVTVNDEAPFPRLMVTLLKDIEPGLNVILLPDTTTVLVPAFTVPAVYVHPDEPSHLIVSARVSVPLLLLIECQERLRFHHLRRASDYPCRSVIS
jgi:hypothetical protein